MAALSDEAAENAETIKEAVERNMKSRENTPARNIEDGEPQEPKEVSQTVSPLFVSCRLVFRIGGACFVVDASIMVHAGITGPAGC